MNLERVTRDDWIIGGLALALVIDLLFLPWFSISASVGAISVSATSTATGAPDGWLGLLAVLALLALIADLAIERFSPQTQIPAIAGGRTATRFILAVIAVAFVALKFLFHIHFSYFGFGFYLAVILCAALVYFTLMARRAGSSMGTRASEPPAATPAGPSGPPLA